MQFQKIEIEANGGVLLGCNEKAFSSLIFLEKREGSGAIDATFQIWRLAQGLNG